MGRDHHPRYCCIHARIGITRQQPFQFAQAFQMLVHIINAKVAFALHRHRVAVIDYQQIQFQRFTVTFGDDVLVDFMHINPPFAEQTYRSRAQFILDKVSQTPAQLTNPRRDFFDLEVGGTGHGQTS